MNSFKIICFFFVAVSCNKDSQTVNSNTPRPRQQSKHLVLIYTSYSGPRETYFYDFWTTKNALLPYYYQPTCDDLQSSYDGISVPGPGEYCLDVKHSYYPFLPLKSMIVKVDTIGCKFVDVN